MNTKSDPQETLKIQQAIRQIEDKLVQWTEHAIKNRQSGDLIKNSQFRNLARVAATTESTEVIKNFLRYQMGRDDKWGRGNNALAHQIITDIGCIEDISSAEDAGRLFKAAHDIASSLLPNDDNFSYKRNNIWLSLIRLYLGYGSRCLVYRQKIGRGSDRDNQESTQNLSNTESKENKRSSKKPVLKNSREAR